MTIKKILVTGSSGTIGTGLCEKLLEEDYEINGVDLKRNKWNNRINKLGPVFTRAQYSFSDNS